MLGKDFAGILGCDYFSAYRKYMGDFNVSLQFCLAQLIRDVKFLATLPEPATVAYGQRLLDALRQFFHILHQRAMRPGRPQFPLHGGPLPFGPDHVA